MTEISLTDVCKTYNPGLFKKKVSALRGLSLDVHSGEVFGLIGPNGAGKSTTIRLLLGLIRPDSGTIIFRGNQLVGRKLLSDIGYLPENPCLYDHLTLKELIVFCGKASGLDTRTIEARSTELFECLALSHAIRRPLRTFSKGMLQRAGICFALLHDPSLVILDEPMSGLDPVGRKMVFDLVCDLKEKGKTVFFCSHILSDVERLCDRIGLLSQGSLLDIFESRSLTSDRQGQVHLRVDTLSEDHAKILAPFVDNIAGLDDGSLLSVDAGNVGAVTAKLCELNIEIRGSREDRQTLEELFMRSIQGGQQ